MRETSTGNACHPLPRGCVAIRCLAATANTPCWPVSGLAEPTRATFPGTFVPSGVCARAEAAWAASSAVPLRGQRRPGCVRPESSACSLCFPFNCAGKNTGAGTNERQCSRARPYNPSQFHAHATTTLAMATVEDLADRVERLLLRHEELRRTAALLEQQLAGGDPRARQPALAAECRAQPHRRAARAPAGRTARAGDGKGATP